MHNNAYQILTEIDEQYNLKLHVWLSLCAIISNMNDEQQKTLKREQIKVHF